MRLTPRCKELLRLLASARWLTTSQVHRRFFARATVNAARRRLRSLANAGYLEKRQEDRMREAVFTLGPEGKRFLEQGGDKEIVLRRQPPKQLEHLTGINDIRIAAEMAGGLAFFFAAWELPAVGWKYLMVPDAVFGLGDRTFAAEYDRGLEGLRYFVGSKIAWYRDGLSGFPLEAVLVVADRDARMRTLARAIADETGRFLFTTIDAIRREGIPESVRGRNACSLEPSRREDGFGSARHFESMDYEKQEIAS